MKQKVIRNIVKIDEEKCDGCGICIPSCAEGALKIIDGKAKLVSDVYCDGLGACLGQCPQDAITIEERVAAEFDEEATRLYLEQEAARELAVLECPVSLSFLNEPETAMASSAGPPVQWPVQLSLVPARAQFLKGADILLAADCTAFIHANFLREFATKKVLLIACPKLDDYQKHLERLANIMREGSPKSVTVVKMEVPCCSGLTQMAIQALQMAGRTVPVKEITINTKGEVSSKAS